MKPCLTVVLAASMFVAFVSVAQAKQGTPSQATLSAMGLSDMQVMSDREAMGVRGMGYYSSNYSSKKSTAVAFGISYAHVGGYGASAGSVDGFYARGRYYAAGEHGSVAGKIIIKYYGGGGHGGPPTNGNYTNGNEGPSYGGGGHGGGKVKVKAIVVFAGGFSVAQAY